jgi:hypothetical protein
MNHLSPPVTTDEALPLMLQFAERANLAPNASPLPPESQPQFESQPGGPSTIPWRTMTDGGRDANIDYNVD